MGLFNARKLTKYVLVLRMNKIDVKSEKHGFHIKHINLAKILFHLCCHFDRVITGKDSKANSLNSE